MSEDLDVKLSMSVDDRASHVFRSLLADVQKLQAGLKSLGTVKFDISAGLNRSAAAAERLRKQQERLASSLKAGLGGKSPAKDAAAWAKSYRERQAAHASMIRHMMSGEASLRRAEASRSEGRRRSIRDESAAEARQFRRREDHLMRLRRGIDQITGPLNRAALLGGLGVLAGSRSAIRSATSLDSASVMSQVHMGLTPQQARALRNSFAIPQGVKLGINPADMLASAVESGKAGVPNKMAPAFTTMIAKLSKGLGADMVETMNNMAYAVQSELGAGRLKGGFQSVRRIGNVSGALAAAMAANPDQMFSFVRTGLGAGAALGLDQAHTLAFGGAATSSGAQGQQAARLLSDLGTDLFRLPQRFMDIARKRNRSAEDRLFLRLPSLLGFGSYNALAQNFRKNPNSALFDLIKSFGKIDDRFTRGQALNAIFGRQFQRFLLNMISSPGTLDQAIKIAEDQAKKNNFDTQVFQKWSSSMQYALNVIGASWDALKAEVGDIFGPFIKDAANFFGPYAEQLRAGNLRLYVRSFMDGLVRGFGFDTFPQLLRSMFGAPGKFNVFAGKPFFDFAQGFAEGLKAIWDSVKGIMHIGGIDGSAKTIGKLAGELIALSAALTLFKPVLSILGGFTDIVKGLGVGWLAKRGTAAVAGSAAGLLGVGAGGMLSAALGVIAAGVVLSVAVMNWDKLGPIFGEVSKSLFGFGDKHSKDMKADERQRRIKSGKAVDPLKPPSIGDIWRHFIGKLSYQSDNAHPWSGLIQKTAFRDFAETATKLSDSINDIGARIMLASYGGPSASAAFAYGGASPSIGRSLPRMMSGGLISGPGFGLAPDGLPGRGPAPDFGLRGHSGYSGGIVHSIHKAFHGKLPRAKWWTPEREGHAVKRLMTEAGLSRAGAIGLVSRWKNVEASQGPWAVNSSSGAIGIEQDLGSRKRGVILGDFDGQLTHAVHQLNSTERSAANMLRHAKTAAEGAIGASMYERAEHYNARTGTDDWTGKSLAGAAGVQSDVDNLIAGVPARTMPRESARTSDHSPVHNNVQIHIHGNNSDPEALANKVQQNLMRHMNRRQHDIELEQT